MTIGGWSGASGTGSQALSHQRLLQLAMQSAKAVIGKATSRVVPSVAEASIIATAAWQRLNTGAVSHCVQLSPTRYVDHILQSQVFSHHVPASVARHHAGGSNEAELSW